MGWPDDLRILRFPGRGPLRIGIQARVIQAGAGTVDGSWWTCARVIQPHWCLYRNHQSGMHLTLADGTDLALDPPATWLLPPWLAYGRRVERVEHQWLHLDLSGPPPGLLAALVPQPLRIAPDRRLDAAWDHLARRCRTADGDPLAAQLEAQATALLALVRVLDQAPAELRRRLAGEVASDVVQPALELIEADPGARLGNSRLARACGLSLSRFALRFRAATGLPPRQYLIDRRLARACALLQAGSLGIEAVAAACGFADRYAFTHLFTRRLGRSPAAYRDGLGGGRRR